MQQLTRHCDRCGQQARTLYVLAQEDLACWTCYAAAHAVPFVAVDLETVERLRLLMRDLFLRDQLTPALWMQCLQVWSSLAVLVARTEEEQRTLGPMDVFPVRPDKPERWEAV